MTETVLQRARGDEPASNARADFHDQWRKTYGVRKGGETVDCTLGKSGPVYRIVKEAAA